MMHETRQTLFRALMAIIPCVFAACSPTEYNYSPTKPGVIEIKTLPESRVLETKAGSNAQTDAMFMRLFNYIKSQHLPMTVPVEESKKARSMRFYVNSAKSNAALPSDTSVSVITLPARKVISCGGRGGYDAASAEVLAKRLEAWMDAHPEIRPTGDAYVVFWDGPFIPAPLRRMEIHVPVAP